MFIDNFNKFV